MIVYGSRDLQKEYVFLPFVVDCRSNQTLAGHSKPVDIWAMGVITYFLLAGFTPFDRDSQQQEMEAIIAGDYKFEPLEYWDGVSDTAKDFVKQCLTIDPVNRPTAAGCLKHKVRLAFWCVDEYRTADGLDSSGWQILSRTSCRERTANRRIFCPA